MEFRAAYVDLNKMLNRAICFYVTAHWFVQSIIFFIFLASTFAGFIVCGSAPTLGWILLGLELGFCVGVIIVDKLSEKIHLFFLGFFTTAILNGFFASAQMEPSQHIDVLGSFLHSFLDALKNILVETSLIPPTDSDLGKCLWAFIIAFLITLLFGVLRANKKEPSGLYVTMDFNRVAPCLLNVLLGDWTYEVTEYDGNISHSGECRFTNTGGCLQFGGDRVDSKDNDCSKTIKWNAKYVLYTNLSEGRFLKFEYNININGKIIEAYSTLDLKKINEGILDGYYYHLVGGKVKGTIRLVKKIS